MLAVAPKQHLHVVVVVGGHEGVCKLVVLSFLRCRCHRRPPDDMHTVSVSHTVLTICVLASLVISRSKSFIKTLWFLFDFICTHVLVATLCALCYHLIVHRHSLETCFLTYLPPVRMSLFSAWQCYTKHSRIQTKRTCNLPTCFFLCLRCYLY